MHKVPITGNETRPAVKAVPGPEGKRIVRKDDKYLVTTTKTAPIAGLQGKGCVVEDVDGNVFLDFSSGIGVVNTGHCHPRVVAAIQDQASRLIHFAATDFYHQPQADLGERLSRIVPVKGATKAFFCNSGTEANEAAIKLARAGTGRHRLLAFQGGFHGRTQGSLSLSASKPVHKRDFFGSMPGVVHAPFPNPYRNTWGIDGYDEPDELTNRAIDHIESMFTTMLPPDDLAAVWWEPVQGEGGYVVPPMGFPRALRSLLDEHGILLVADEVQTGFGRTGKWFGSEHFDVQVDVIALAKALGSGFPIGAAVCRGDLDFEEKGMHSNTYGGNVVGCAAALATIDVLDQEDLVGNAARMGNHLGKRLEAAKEAYPQIGDHRGLGLMRAIEFVDAKGAPDMKTRDAIEDALWKRGLMTLGCGRSSLRVIPPLVVNEAQIDGAMDVLDDALKATLRRTVTA